MKVTFGSLFAFFFGVVMVALSSAESVDYHTYGDWFSRSWHFDISNIYGIMTSLWSSAFFFIVFGFLHQLAPLLPYFTIWVIFWVGMTLHGYRGVH